MKQIHLLISGLVQGVCFRFFVEDRANELGLTGYVRNLEDGKVEVLAEGEEEQLKKLCSFASKGPVAAKVTDVEEKWNEAQNKWKGFGIYG